MNRDELEAIRDALRGEAEPLATFGVRVVDVPWWRRRVQRYVMPRRYKRWAQLKILADLERGVS